MDEREAKAKIKYLVRIGFMKENDTVRRIAGYGVRRRLESKWAGRTTFL